MSLPTSISMLGFTTVRHFQQAYNLGIPLVVDGIVGPKTSSAAAKCALLHQEGKPDISPHFSVAEFSCKCGGRLQGCQRVIIVRGLLSSLEEQRRFLGNEPVRILDGYRCPLHNRAVGGVGGSQHLLGAAVDLIAGPKLTKLKPLGAYSGYGTSRSTGIVEHVDRRDISGDNPTHSTRSSPALWLYA